MTFKKRKLLFIIIILFFLIIGPLVVLYSEGYKFDFQNKKFVQTGGIFVKTYPPDCQVYINNKLEKKTNLFTGTTLISNLLPKKYYIEVKKDDYFPWSKNLRVEEKKVTDAKNIYLIPKRISFTRLKVTPSTNTSTSSIRDFILSHDQSKISFYQTYKNNQRISIMNLDNKEIETLWQSKKKENTKLIKFYWSPDDQKLVSEWQGPKNKIYLIINLTNDKITLSTSTEYIFSLLDIPKNKKLSSDVKNSTCYKILPHSILFLSKEGFLVKSNLDGTISKIYNLNPIKVDKNNNYQIISQGDKNLLLKENKKLYYLDSESHSFRKISDSVDLISFSPDSNKLAFSNGYSIWLFYLKPEYSQPRRKAQELVFLTRFSQPIFNLSWLNSNYLIFSSGNKIKISEIDNRDRINIKNIATFQNPKFSFRDKDKRLYLLNQGNLYISQPIK